MTGTLVTATDFVTGESETIKITDDYVLVCDGTCFEASVQTYANGTHVITIKGRKRA